MTAAHDDHHQKVYTGSLIVGIGTFVLTIFLYVLVFGLLFKNSTFSLLLTSTLCALVVASLAALLHYSVSNSPPQL